MIVKPTITIEKSVEFCKEVKIFDNKINVGSATVGDVYKMNAELKEIVIYESFRNRGFGKHLMKQIEGFLIDSGSTFLQLTANQSVYGFYEKLGYKNIYTLSSDYSIFIKNLREKR